MYRAIIVLLSVALFTTVSVSAREIATNQRERQIKNSQKNLHVLEKEMNSEFVEIRIEGPDGVVRVKRIPKDKILR